MPEYREDGSRVWDSPVIGYGDYDLSYRNTRIRMFSAEWDYLNHIEFAHDSGELEGVIIDEDMMQQLLAEDFPRAYDHYPDGRTIQWFLKLATDKVIEEFNGNAA